MTNHGTNVGWSCYRGGHVSEVENLGVNFPPKKLHTVSLACMHDLGDARSPFHDKNSYFLEKDDSDISPGYKYQILRLAFIFCCIHS
jgi:hypothetical protein